LAVVPIAGWPQLQLTLWGILGLCVLAAALAARWLQLRRYTRRLAAKTHGAGWFARGVLDFLQHLRMIGQAHVLLHNALLTTGYMLALVVAFRCVGADVSHAPLSFHTALTTYAFGLLIAMSLGSMLSQFGVLELTGAAAAQAAGLSLQDGLAALLWLRLLWTLSSWGLCTIIVLLLRRELLRLTGKDD